MFLYPDTITSLKHTWSHPVFEKIEAVEWLTNYAKELGMTYEQLIAIAENYQKDGEKGFLNHDLPDICYENAKEFLYYIEIILGPMNTENDFLNIFRCGC